MARRRMGVTVTLYSPSIMGDRGWLKPLDDIPVVAQFSAIIGCAPAAIALVNALQAVFLDGTGDNGPFGQWRACVRYS